MSITSLAPERRSDKDVVLHERLEKSLKILILTFTLVLSKSDT